MSTPCQDFQWNFHRLGGLDQATLETAEELRNLRDLNPKLWVALSCPASGLEFDQRTLALLDTDKDGRIRMPEVLAAVNWLTARLADPAVIVNAPEELSLSSINRETPEGTRLYQTALSVLEGLGKPEAETLSGADVAAALEHAEQNTFNGDGIIPPLEEFGPDAVAFIEDALAVVGGVRDSGGTAGVNAEIANAFVATLGAWRAWRNSVDHTATPLGANTPEAWKLAQELRDKVEDYFLRCDMASFAPWTLADPQEEDRPQTLDHGILETAALENLPLARVEADRPLCLVKGINPAWRKRLTRFAELVRPLLADPETLSRQDWETLLAAFAPYEAALAKKPAAVQAAVTVPPTQGAGNIDQLGEDRVARHLDGASLQTVLDLVEKDAAAPAASTDIADLERLVLYHAHLHRLLMNFVSFRDFYSLRHKAMFQSGTLFLDGRSCRLCLPVTDVEAHAKLATLSQLCLVYCRCTRAKDAPETGVEEKSIVAAVTAGNADMLVVGRNGVFVDSAGRDWDCSVTKVVLNPISIKQAIWDPYRRAARAVGDQISKFAANKQADIAKSLSSTAADTAAGKAPAFDIGKSMGIFAAIGLALGALGTAVASIANSLFSLNWWQFPLVFVGAFLLISGPSMVLAWVKLRKRNLGPLLEASGWAVNTMAPINLTLGKQLTDTAVLPCNAHRSFNDPLSKAGKGPLYLALILGVLVAAAGLWVWHTWPNVRLPWELLQK